jgi:hypothetical protein
MRKGTWAILAMAALALAACSDSTPPGQTAVDPTAVNFTDPSGTTAGLTADQVEQMAGLGALADQSVTSAFGPKTGADFKQVKEVATAVQKVFQNPLFNDPRIQYAILPMLSKISGVPLPTKRGVSPLFNPKAFPGTEGACTTSGTLTLDVKPDAIVDAIVAETEPTAEQIEGWLRSGVSLTMTADACTDGTSVMDGVITANLKFSGSDNNINSSAAFSCSNFSSKDGAVTNISCDGSMAFAIGMKLEGTVVTYTLGFDANQFALESTVAGGGSLGMNGAFAAQFTSTTKTAEEFSAAVCDWLDISAETCGTYSFAAGAVPGFDLTNWTFKFVADFTLTVDDASKKYLIAIQVSVDTGVPTIVHAWWMDPTDTANYIIVTFTWVDNNTFTLTAEGTDGTKAFTCDITATAMLDVIGAGAISCTDAPL